MTFANSLYTLWRFTSPSTGESKRVWRTGHYTDPEYQHEYQRVLWHGYAENQREATRKAASA